MSQNTFNAALFIEKSFKLFIREINVKGTLTLKKNVKQAYGGMPWASNMNR
jgi:hypothetical protein